MSIINEGYEARSEHGLRTGAVGLREILFQSITDMAPGAAVAASIPAGVAYAGGAMPLAVLLALVGALLTAWCIGNLARELPSAGSLATYTARGLHPTVGFLVGWGYAITGALIPPLVTLQLGFTVAQTLHGEWASFPADLWWPFSVAGVLIVYGVGLVGIKASTKMGTILGIFEIAVFVVLAVIFIVDAGSRNTLSVFGTHYTPAAHRGLSGVFAASVFTVLAFGGLEGATPLAEEAANPRKVVRQAVLTATLLIGIFYVFTTYAASVEFGPSRFSTFGIAGPASWVGIAHASYGIMWVLAFLAIINSTIANSNAGVNVSSRVAFAMGRIRVFPPAFAKIHRESHVPWVGVTVASAISLAVVLGLGFGYGPDTGFAMVGTGLGILLASVYILCNAACIGYFARRGRGFHIVSHGLVPVLGIIAFVPAWLSAVGIPAFSFISPLSTPYSYVAYALGAWMLVGLIWLIVLERKHPKRVHDVGIVHLDDAPETAGA